MLCKLSILLFGIIISIAFSDAITFEEDLTLSPVQKMGLDKFKKKMLKHLPHEYMKEDMYLIRWLRAQNFDLKEAEAMLMNNLNWRAEHKMDTIHEEDWSDFENDYKYWLEGRDKEGKPILYLNVGTHDVRKAIVTGKTERYLRFVDKSQDETFNLVRSLGKKYGNVTRSQVIYDMDGFNLVQHACLQCVPIVLRMLNSYQLHFPQVADQIVFVNAPGIFEQLLTALRAISDPETKRSMKVYGTNKKLWHDKMASDFDFNELPPSLGGTKLYEGMEDI